MSNSSEPVENIRYYRISDLTPWKENYRTGDIDSIKESFRSFGFNGVLRVWRDGIVMAGNQSLEALRQLYAENPTTPPVKVGLAKDGEWLVPGDDISHLPKWKAIAFAVADNRTHDRGTYDEKQLAGLLTDLSANQPNDFKATGYSEQDLDRMINEAKRVDKITQTRGATPAEALETYQNSTIKQIVLYFSGEEFQSIVDRLQLVSTAFSVESNTEAVVKLLEFYEQHND